MKRLAAILRFLAHNQRVRLRHWLARSDRYSGSLSHLSAEEIAAHARKVFANYRERGALRAEMLAGKDVLELGPGDNLGVALLFAAAGARVTTLDKFRYRYDTTRHVAIVRALGVDAALMERVRPICGFGLEEAGHGLDAPSFDYILSNAVLEELPDPDSVFRAMDRLLRPGGALLHQIDLSDYGMFSSRGFAPLEFLTVSDVVYRAMTRHSGGPNRRLADYYRERMRALGLEVKLSITHVYGEGAEAAAAVERIRPRLLSRYRRLSAEDLLTYGLFLIARKRTDSAAKALS